MMCTIFLLFFNCTATTEISPYGHTLSLRDALPIYLGHRHVGVLAGERAPVHEVPERDGPPSVLSEAEISHARNLSGAGQEARRRCRRMRRRSFSVAPPQTPSFSRPARAYSRPLSRTVHSNGRATWRDRGGQE